MSPAESGLAGLVVGHVLGEGGTGVVREAHEPDLDRDLALKQIKDEARRRPGVASAVLAEARVTGAMAHPNVVPIHEVFLDERGLPQIVLKRIHGRPWGRLLREPAAVARLHQRRDTLLFHIEVLEQVCAAVEAAHARGIVHRDLKPGNIMVGRHGEVYVLDWGLAVTLRDEADSALPRPSKSGKSSGTPQYMAPEMVSARFGEVGPWSDVYLLGGLLYHVLFGRPPHHGADLWQMLLDAFENGVDVPDEGPPELVALCRDCLRRIPSERPADAHQVRRRLRTWLDHRPSAALTEEGATQVALLESLWSANEPGANRRLHERFGAAAFVLRRALDLWPENAEAQRLLARLVARMVDRELAEGTVAGAEGALCWLKEVPTDLATRVERRKAAALREAKKQATIRQWIGDEASRARTVATATLMGFGLSLGFGAIWPEIPDWTRGVGLLAFLACAGAGALTAYTARTHQARTSAALLVLAGASHALLSEIALRGGWTLEATSATHGALYALVAGIGALTGQRWLLAVVALGALAIPASIAAPPSAPWLLLVLGVVATAAWRAASGDPNQGGYRPGKSPSSRQISRLTSPSSDSPTGGSSPAAGTRVRDAWIRPE